MPNTETPRTTRRWLASLALPFFLAVASCPGCDPDGRPLLHTGEEPIKDWRDDDDSAADDDSSADDDDNDTSVADADHDGWTEEEGDCDDTDWDISPDMEEECDDGLDNDCDGIVDEADCWDNYAVPAYGVSPCRCEASTSSWDQAPPWVLGLAGLLGLRRRRNHGTR